MWHLGKPSLSLVKHCVNNPPGSHLNWIKTTLSPSPTCLHISPGSGQGTNGRQPDWSVSQDTRQQMRLKQSSKKFCTLPDAEPSSVALDLSDPVKTMTRSPQTEHRRTTLPKPDKAAGSRRGRKIKLWLFRPSMVWQAARADRNTSWQVLFLSL